MAKTTTQMASPTNIDFSVYEEQYEHLEDGVEDILNGNMEAAYVNGSPGFGKSYMVLHAIEDWQVANPDSNYNYGNKPKQERYCGHMTDYSLYRSLYALRRPGDVLILDDVDSVYTRDIGCNILKAAMDSNDCRRISWVSETSMLVRDEIESPFLFEGGVIIVSNHGFLKSTTHQKTNANALISRSLHIPVGPAVGQPPLPYVMYMIEKQNILDIHELTDEEKDEIKYFIYNNNENWIQFDLRLVRNIVKFFNNHPSDWQARCKTFFMK